MWMWGENRSCGVRRYVCVGTDLLLGCSAFSIVKAGVVVCGAIAWNRLVRPEPTNVRFAFIKVTGQQQQYHISG